jgi:hypothetical protein
MMEAARTSETSVDIYLTTRQHIPESSELIGSYVVILKVFLILILGFGSMDDLCIYVWVTVHIFILVLSLV